MARIAYSTKSTEPLYKLIKDVPEEIRQSLIDGEVLTSKGDGGLGETPWPGTAPKDAIESPPTGWRT